MVWIPENVIGEKFVIVRCRCDSQFNTGFSIAPVLSRMLTIR